MNRSMRFAALIAAIALQTSCGGSNVNPVARQPQSLVALQRPASSVNAIYSIDFNNDRLEFWPLSPAGGPKPTTLSAKSNHEGMAADGNDLLFGAASTPALEIFDVTTQTATLFGDPYGSPGDVAVDKNHNIYVLNFATPNNNVAEFPARDRTHPVELSCNLLHIGGVIATDNENDVFAIATGPPPGFATVVLEYPSMSTGHGPCQSLNLIGAGDGASGVVIDPKTDDLLIMDNPDQCAGGSEGRVRIFPKPYQRKNYSVLHMGANCSGGLRLNADSTVIFAGDEDVSGSFTFILQRTYPGGRKLGTYGNGDPTAFATIPNTLPN